MNNWMTIIWVHISDPDKKSLNSYRTVQSKITYTAPVGHSTKLPQHTTTNTPAPAQMSHSDNAKDQDNDIRL